MTSNSDREHLPEFRIRGLSNGISPDTPEASANQTTGQHAYKMRKASYDELLVKHPHAALSYNDADDGEKITVGSGLELEQRLQEPLPITDTREAPHPLIQPPHSFDVDTDARAREVWKARYQQEKSQSAAVEVSSQAISLEQQAKQMTQDVEDRIGRLAAKMSSTQLNETPHSTAVSNKASMQKADTLIDQRAPHYERNHPPSLALDYSELYTGKTQTMDVQGSHTTEGTKMAQQATTAMPSKSVTRRTSSVDPSNFAYTPEKRWTSYGSSNSWSKAAPAELAGAAPTPRVEIGTSKSDGQPLLQMFEAELAKIAKNADTEDKSPSSPGASKEKLVAKNANEATSDGDSYRKIDIAKLSIKSLCESIGDLAADALEQRLVTTGKDLQSGLDEAVKTSREALSLPKTTRQSLESDTPPDQPFRMGKLSNNIDGGLLWTNNPRDDPRHQIACLTRCLVGCGPCPVRETIKDAARLVEQQDESLRHSNDSNSEIVSQRRQIAQLHQSTQTALKELELSEDKHSFEADRILAKRYISYSHLWGHAKVQYLIRWVGHGPEHDVWYDSENLGGCKGLVKHYEKNCPKDIVGLRKDELHAIHLRTAGDRMVASRKWDEAEEVENHRRFHTDPSFRQKQLQDLRSAQIGEVRKAKTLEEPAKSEHVQARSSSLDARATPNASAGSSHSTLRHRKSWHPSSSTVALQRAVSPTAAAQKYPAISSFEAAHHGAKVGRQKGIPAGGQEIDVSRLPYSLDFPHVDEARLTWLDDPSEGPTQKDKSVRFDLKDPWTQKKLAQEHWESKQKEEESLYGAPEAEAKKEGKKPARYCSPPPPKSAFAELPPVPVGPTNGNPGLSSGKIWEELNENAHLRRVKSLNFPKQRESVCASATPLRRSSLRFSSSDEPTNWRPHASAAVHGPVSNDFFGPIRPKRDPPWLRRSASFRQTSPCEGRAPNNKREESPSRDATQAMPSQNRELKDSINPGLTAATFQPIASSMDDFFGVNPRAQDRSNQPKKDPWAFLYDNVKDESAHINFPAMTPQKPALAPAPVTVPTMPPPAPSSTAPKPPRRQSMRPCQEVPPSVRARSEKIRDTIDKLVSMGFGTREAKLVSEGVDGDLELAIDMLEEDREARAQGFLEKGEEEKERKMPGAF